MLLKVALILGGLGVIWYAGRQIASTGSNAINAVGNVAEAAGNAITGAAQAINPLNNDNVIYHTANWLTGGTPDRPIGVRLYEFFNPDPFKK